MEIRLAATDSTPLPGARLASSAGRVLVRPWLRVLAVAIAITMSLWSFDRVPAASWQPAVLGLMPWVIGKYLLCPLRWHALSVGGRTRRWHMRVYAESELLGLASPGHVGADLWRMHRLQTDAHLDRPCAVAEVALDRFIGALTLCVFVPIAGVELPPYLLVAALGIAAVVLVVARAVKARRPALLEARPWPPWRVVLKCFLLTVAYQMTTIGLLMGTVSAMGAHLPPLALLGAFGASQVAGILPGVNGASPREGALVFGLAALGISWQAAVGAVALFAVLAWVPALLLGGGSFVGTRLAGRRSAVA
jgi:hypothetical protein